uniref:Uncharacterized protein n=1 Tax=Plectus sambesii TaxID=2011161 RepID=A0A914WEP6_9BILA
MAQNIGYRVKQLRITGVFSAGAETPWKPLDGRWVRSSAPICAAVGRQSFCGTDHTDTADVVAALANRMRDCRRKWRLRPATFVRTPAPTTASAAAAAATNDHLVATGRFTSPNRSSSRLLALTIATD